jgi:hypothetical protein
MQHMSTARVAVAAAAVAGRCILVLHCSSTDRQLSTRQGAVLPAVGVDMSKTAAAAAVAAAAVPTTAAIGGNPLPSQAGLSPCCTCATRVACRAPLAACCSCQAQLGVYTQPSRCTQPGKHTACKA